MPVELTLPNIGDFTDVEVIDVHVKAGDQLAVDDPILTLESDKATMEIPAETAGIVRSVAVKTGDAISEGAPLLTLETSDATADAAEDKAPDEPESAVRPQPAGGRQADITTDVVVLGSGPGGYTAAFRAADLGKTTVLIERHEALGGVCLNVGCIPSKALLHAAGVISDARAMAGHGIDFGEPRIDNTKLASWKDRVVGQLTRGLKSLARQRDVTVIHGTGRFVAAHRIAVESGQGERLIQFDNAIIAAGSKATRLPAFPDDPRIMDSTGALQLTEIPERLLVIGGGIIGLEMAAVYHELGSEITVVEMLDSLIAGADADIVQPLQKRIQKQYRHIYLKTAVTDIQANESGLHVRFEGEAAPKEAIFERVLVAVGRRPNGHNIGAEHAGVHVTEPGFIPVDGQQRSNVAHIFAIGDIVGPPMLAHKAVHEGKVAAEVIAGLKSRFDARVIPSVAYTDPEVAWVGVTETEAKAQGIAYGKGVFPWAASGRALAMGRNEGMSKLLFDEQTQRVIGAGIVGPHAGDLIAEVALAIEMGCDARDIGLTIHPHPTLSESVAFAAEMFEGTITDLYVPKKK